MVGLPSTIGGSFKSGLKIFDPVYNVYLPHFAWQNPNLSSNFLHQPILHPNLTATTLEKTSEANGFGSFRSNPEKEKFLPSSGVNVVISSSVGAIVTKVVVVSTSGSAGFAEITN